MIKKIKFLLISFLFLFPLNTFAWHGAYNYEVTDFNVVDGIATLEGWAILNARNGYSGQGNGDVLTGSKNRQSGKSVINSKVKYTNSQGNTFYGLYCDGGDMNYYNNSGSKVTTGKNLGWTYQYTLSIYRVYNDDTEEKLDIDIDYENKNTSLTYSQAYKCGNVGYYGALPSWYDSSSCPAKNYTACYENVGFRFNFDYTKLNASANVKGYKLKLTVKTGALSGCTTNCQETFTLNVVSGNFENSDIYFKNTTEKVKILLTYSRPWTSANISSDKKWLGNGVYLNYLGEYNVYDTVYDANGYTWYKIKDNSDWWVPSSWVWPSLSSETLVIPTDTYEEKEVLTCTESNVSQGVSNKSTTCDGKVSFSDDTTESCDVETGTNNYYKVVCDEDLSVDMNPSMLNTIDLGSGFDYKIKVSTKRTCKGTFNATEFLKAYNNLQDNINNLEKYSTEWYNNRNKASDLQMVLLTYNNWSGGNYTLSSVRATLKDNQLGTTVNLVTSSTSNSTPTKKIDKEHELNITGYKNPVDFTYTETLEKEFKLPEAYFDNSTKKINYSYCSGCVQLGNKYYISNNLKYNNTDYKYKVTVSNLGFDKKWTASTNNCSLRVIANESFYRPIDNADPFISSNTDRETGKNWSNDTFDFTSIIESDVWEQEPAYEMSISKNNIENIRENNSADAFIGTGCKINTSTGKYECDFLRDSRYISKSNLES